MQRIGKPQLHANCRKASWKTLGLTWPNVPLFVALDVCHRLAVSNRIEARIAVGGQQ